ncbi:MAG: cyclopropane-fatty-acyl-phospholipid synthase family protein, partial [Pseudomonadota bacterium]|nr:cyclopropane-fatty-acyl-phospholipid synthase family protein [Pseudomonadota bacterium]
FGRAGTYPEPRLKLHSYKVVARSIRRGSLGFAESYLGGEIDCDDLVGLFRFFLRNRRSFSSAGRGLFRVRAADRIAHLRRRNSRAGSRRNIAEHYDLGNSFYRLWLDESMTYSSGYFAAGARSLEEAQAAKYRLLDDMLDLKSGHSVLEVGCGWGGFALQAARDKGAQVSAITLSREQLTHARSLANAAGVSDRCALRLEDYRDVSGTYDRVVSIEMIEAVGEESWPVYFRMLHDRLKPGGAAVIQAITIDDAQFDRYRRKTDFIQRYIFPGGMLPTKAVLAAQGARAGLRLSRATGFGNCYARTLAEWRQRFHANWPCIERLGFDESFRRRWDYYLAYCEAGFAAGCIDVSLFRFEKPA